MRAVIPMISSRVLFASLLVALCLGAGCVSSQPPAVAEKKGYSFWPPAPDEPHVQFLVAFNATSDITPPPSALEKAVYGAESSTDISINKPYGVRMWNGCIYICDIRGNGVTILDLAKKQARVMGATGVTTITKAVDLTITPDGTKYVLDSGKSAILVFGSDDRFQAKLNLERDAAPAGIANFGNLLYVTDLKSKQVRVLDRATGRQLRTLGEPGGEDGQFVGPLGVATDKTGNVYVSDTLRAHVQKFSPEGQFLLGWGEAGTHPGNFIRPKQLAVGGDLHIHVVDASLNNVQVFDPEGRFVGYYGSIGLHPGAMDLPAGMDIDENPADVALFAKYVHPAFEVERLVLVANQFGKQKICVYAMGHLKPGKTLADIASNRAKVETGLAPSTQPTTAPSTPKAK